MTLISELLHTPENYERARQIFMKINEEYAPLIPLRREGYKLRDEGLRLKLVEVAGAVDNILGTSAELPGIIPDLDITFSDYTRSLIRISNGDSFEKEAVSSIAHEYSHHLQCLSPLLVWKHCGALTEGFARGIELMIGRKYADKTKDLRYKRGALENVIGNMNYFLGTGRFPVNPENAKRREDSLKYVYGSTAFMIAQEIHGEGIYRELINHYDPHGRLCEILGEKK